MLERQILHLGHYWLPEQFRLPCDQVRPHFRVAPADSVLLVLGQAIERTVEAGQ
jgi:hypothetical protein